MTDMDIWLITLHPCMCKLCMRMKVLKAAARSSQHISPAGDSHDPLDSLLSWSLPLLSYKAPDLDCAGARS